MAGESNRFFDEDMFLGRKNKDTRNLGGLPNQSFRLVEGITRFDSSVNDVISLNNSRKRAKGVKGIEFVESDKD